MSEAVAPASCEFPMFRERYWAAASWAVERSSSSCPEPEPPASQPCRPVRRLSHKQEMHLKSIERLDLHTIEASQQEDKPTEELKVHRDSTSCLCCFRVTACGRGRAPAVLSKHAHACSRTPWHALAQARREKFAFFEKHCSPVYESIFLGSDWVARSRELLDDNGVTHVVNCVGFLSQNYHAEHLQYKTLYLQGGWQRARVCVGGSGRVLRCLQPAQK